MKKQNKLMQQCIDWYSKNIIPHELKDVLLKISEYDCLFLYESSFDGKSEGLLITFADKNDERYNNFLNNFENYNKILIENVKNIKQFEFVLLNYLGGDYEKIFLKSNLYKNSKELKQICFEYFKNKNNKNSMIIDVNFTVNFSVNSLLLLKTYDGSNVKRLFVFITNKKEEEVLNNLEIYKYFGTVYIISEFDNFIYELNKII